MLDVAISGSHLRVADPDWPDPLNATYAAQGGGRRWNPPGLPCLYLNCDPATARANVQRMFVGLPYGPEDLDPATAPVLVEVDVPAGRAANAYSDEGLAALGLPMTYPLDLDGSVIPHATCKPHGRDAFDRGLDGVDARSAASGGDRELAWFPRDRTPAAGPPVPFDEWWYA